MIFELSGSNNFGGSQVSFLLINISFGLKEHADIIINNNNGNIFWYMEKLYKKKNEIISTFK